MVNLLYGWQHLYNRKSTKLWKWKKKQQHSNKNWRNFQLTFHSELFDFLLLSFDFIRLWIKQWANCELAQQSEIETKRVLGHFRRLNFGVHIFIFFVVVYKWFINSPLSRRLLTRFLYVVLLFFFALQSSEIVETVPWFDSFHCCILRCFCFFSYRLLCWLNLDSCFVCFWLHFQSVDFKLCIRHRRFKAMRMRINCSELNFPDFQW